MPFPVPFLPIVLIVAFASAISMWLINHFSSAKIRETQTHFAIRQITERLDQIEEADFPRTTADLIDSLESSRIDWNSCGIQGEQILDGWGIPIITTFDKKNERWSFHSFGRDGRSGSADDIEAVTNRNRTDGQAAPSDGDKYAN